MHGWGGGKRGAPGLLMGHSDPAQPPRTQAKGGGGAKGPHGRPKPAPPAASCDSTPSWDPVRAPRGQGQTHLLESEKAPKETSHCPERRQGCRCAGEPRRPQDTAEHRSAQVFDPPNRKPNSCCFNPSSVRAGRTTAEANSHGSRRAWFRGVTRSTFH